MDYFKTYRKDGVILFDINLLGDGTEAESGFYTIESNIPNQILELAYPNYYDDLIELDGKNKPAIEIFLTKLCDAVFKLNEAKYFFWPSNSIHRVLDVQNCFRKMRSFELEKDILPNTIYSINENSDVFYFFSKGFSEGRLFSEQFEMETIRINKQAFEKLLPLEHGQAYFDLMSNDNIFFYDKTEDALVFLMADKDYFPLLFFWKEIS